MALMDRSSMFRMAGTATTYAPYIRRLMRDDRLRGELRSLIKSASHLYQELADDDSLDKVLKDDKIRKDIDHMLEAMQKAGQRAMAQRRGTNWFAIAMVSGIAGGIVALLVYPRTRHGIQSTVVQMRRRGVHAVEDVQEKVA